LDQEKLQEEFSSLLVETTHTYLWQGEGNVEVVFVELQCSLGCLHGVAGVVNSGGIATHTQLLWKQATQ